MFVEVGSYADHILSEVRLAFTAVGGAQLNDQKHMVVDGLFDHEVEVALALGPQ